MSVHEGCERVRMKFDVALRRDLGMTGGHRGITNAYTSGSCRPPYRFFFVVAETLHSLALSPPSLPWISSFFHLWFVAGSTRASIA